MTSWDGRFRAAECGPKRNPGSSWGGQVRAERRSALRKYLLATKKCDKSATYRHRIAYSKAATRRSRLKNLDYFGSCHHNNGRFGHGGRGKDAEFFGRRR